MVNQRGKLDGAIPLNEQRYFPEFLLAIFERTLVPGSLRTNVVVNRFSPDRVRRFI